jgi:two-component system sensor histidine kinase KdpD
LAKHKVEVSLEAGLPLLRLDPVLFEQALFNLLDNAGKYSPEHSTVWVRAARIGGRIQLSVADEGEGIPAADAERIFDKFYRVRESDNKRAGTGLGLAISRGFVEAMNGTLTASNRSDGQGAILTINLPVPEQAELSGRAA